MNLRQKCSWVVVVCLVVAAVAVVSFSVPAAEQKTPVYRYVVVHAYPHDRFAFTEGLAYSGGMLVDGTGLNGNSTLRRVNLTTGEVVQERQLADEYFGEGVTVFGDRIAEVTEDSHVGFIYNATTLAQVGSFGYPTEGWGIAWDGAHLVMSDGTATLHFLDPETFREVRQVEVQDHGVPVQDLNELEYVNGEIWANVWPTDRIVRISPSTGRVTGWVDLSGLLPPQEQGLIGWSAIAWLNGHTSVPFGEEACLNGIAYDPAGDRLFVTGKLWPELFEVRVVR